MASVPKLLEFRAASKIPTDSADFVPKSKWNFTKNSLLILRTQIDNRARGLSLLTHADVLLFFAGILIAGCGRVMGPRVANSLILAGYPDLAGAIF